MTPKLSVSIRWFAITDLWQVLAVDRACESAWTELAFLANLRRDGCVCQVAEASDGQIVSFMVYTMGKRIFHVDKVAVHPTFRRMGVGSALIGRLVSFITDPGCPRRKIMADVLETNLDAHLFLRSCGFRWVQTLHGVDPETEVAYLFARRAGAGDFVTQPLGNLVT